MERTMSMLRVNKDWDWYDEPVKLIGGFGCRLTMQETNEWHEHLETLPAFELLRDAKTDEAVYFAQIAAGIAGADEKYRAAKLAVRTYSEALYCAGKEWYADVLKRRNEKMAAKKKEQAT